MLLKNPQMHDVKYQHIHFEFIKMHSNQIQHFITLLTDGIPHISVHCI
jgi:hypothetical protein